MDGLQTTLKTLEVDATDHTHPPNVVHFKQVPSSGTSQLQSDYELLNALQTTLDPIKLIELFSQQAQSLVGFNGIVYEHKKRNIRVFVGQEATHNLSYNLIVEGQQMGNLSLYRDSTFSDKESAVVEHLLCNLVYSLRNALLYLDAVQNSQTDPVTDTLNRSAFSATLQQEVSLAQRGGHPLSLIVLDIDNFKLINDSHGHAVGDRALKAAAKIILENIRQSDSLFRYGGDEFTIILRQTAARGACQLAERIRASIENLSYFDARQKVSFTMSLGVASFRPQDNEDILFQRADAALMHAKKMGRNQVSCAEDFAKESEREDED